MAQIIATNFPGKVQNLVTFQSPGINLSTQSQFNRLKKSEKPKHITHHIADNDFVDFAGYGNLPGTVYEHEQEFSWNPLAPHKAFLFGTDRFRRRRERLGLSNHFMEREMNKNIRSGNPSITKYRRYPYERLRVEQLRKLASYGTSLLTVPFDVLSSQRPDESGTPIASPHAMKKIHRILDSLEGWTSNKDMDEIIDILKNVKSRSEMSEIHRVIEPTVAHYLVDIGNRIKIRLAFKRLL